MGDACVDVSVGVEREQVPLNADFRAGRYTRILGCYL